MRILLTLGVIAWHASILSMVIASYVPAFSFKRSIKLFSTKSLKAIADFENGNFVYSPLDIAMILTMMAFGARDRTETQLRRGLELPIDDAVTKDEIMTILIDLKSTKDYEMHLANKLFYNENFRLKDEFTNMTRSVFSTALRKADFRDYDGTRRLINAWSALQTNHCIPEIFESWAISEDTKILLASVACFKGTWSLPFISDRTMPREFYLNGDVAQYVDTMFVAGYFRYGELPVADATFVELPYKVPKNANAMSMYVILPNRRHGLATLIGNFHTIDEHRLLHGESRAINIYLPKFKFRNSIELRRPLGKMGLLDMFRTNSNFSGIVEEELFMVTSFVQKSTIEVTEDSDPDASVTQIDLERQTHPYEFHVEHPFVCVIMKEDGIPLFIAIVKNPLRVSSLANQTRLRTGFDSQIKRTKIY